MNTILVRVNQAKHAISRHIYGHFSEHLGRCIYDGFWVGEDSPIPNTRGIRKDIVEALRQIRIPNLRWPGGCFADSYHWKDGIGPRERRGGMVNIHWGGVVENNHFGTHEFMDLCEQLGCEPYICGNVGSGTVQEMAQWVEYLTFDSGGLMAELRRSNGRDKPWKLHFWGVGNENWGCGGSMRPEYYADLYRQYQMYCRNFSDNFLCKIACGPNKDDYNWTKVMMERAGSSMGGLGMHYYFTQGPWNKKGSATDFTVNEYLTSLTQALHMDTLIRKHSAIMDERDPDKRIMLAVDEWGIWLDNEPGTNPVFLYQQNSMRDALAAAITLNIFNNHADRVRLASLAQTVNVLQSMVLTDGPRMLRTPTWHVFEMYTPHHDAVMIPTDVACEYCDTGSEPIASINASASRIAGGDIHISVCNLLPDHETTVRIVMPGADVSAVSGRVLASETFTNHNTFDEPNRISAEVLEEIDYNADEVTVRLPRSSVSVLTISLS